MCWNEEDKWGRCSVGQLMIRGMGAGLEDLVCQPDRLRLDCTGPGELQLVPGVKQIWEAVLTAACWWPLIQTCAGF